MIRSFFLNQTDGFIDVVSCGPECTTEIQRLMVRLNEVKSSSRWVGLQWAIERLCDNCVVRLGAGGIKDQYKCTTTALIDDKLPPSPNCMFPPQQV